MYHEDYFDDCEVCQVQKKADKEGRLVKSQEIIDACRRQKASAIRKAQIAGEDDD